MQNATSFHGTAIAMASRASRGSAAVAKADKPPVEPEKNERLVAFDATKQDLIIDFKSVAEIPFDPQTNGVKVLRSIIYDKGTCCANPDDASKMVIVGEWRRQFSLTLVHFAESTAREPELLLYFVDYGFCKGDLEGVSVETLPLPLCLKKNTYQTDTRLTPIADVAGFEAITLNHAPWSVQLKPTLKHFTFFKHFGVFDYKDMQAYIKSPLLERLDKLVALACEELDKETAAIVRQDKTVGEKQKALFKARLDALCSALKAQPLAGFDKTLDHRITVLKKSQRGLVDAPVWLSTPQAKKLMRGEYHLGSELRPKKLQARFAEAAQAQEEPAVEKSPDAPPKPNDEQGDKSTDIADKERDSDSEEEFPFTEEDQPALGKREARERKSPKVYAPPEPKLKKAKQDVPKSKAKDKDDEGLLINPRTGKLYVKGPYNTGGKGSLKALSKEAKFEKGPSSRDLEELKTIKEKLAVQAGEIKDLKHELAEAISAQHAAEAALKYASQANDEALKGAHAQGKLEVMGEATRQFQLGLQAGASLAGNTSFSFPAMPGPSGA